MKLLNRYLNGNVTVTLFDNGTKIQEWDDNESPSPIYPNSMDIKITNKCSLGEGGKSICKWCHEKSVPNGEHGDLDYLFNIIKDLPVGSEIAVGGGNTLCHPDLISFLDNCKYVGLICNMTVNYQHLKDEKYLNIVNYLLRKNLVYGVGVSIPDNFDEKVIESIVDKRNVVYHVIAGVNKISILDKIKSSCVSKCLILGYKDFGRGIEYHKQHDSVNPRLQEWKDNIHNYVKKVHLSFDNLALSQLPIKEQLTNKEWDEFYCGADGVFTMYISAVDKEYAISSTSSKRYPLEGNIVNIFKTIRDAR